MSPVTDDHIQFRPPYGRYTMWAGPADGANLDVNTVGDRHPDVEVPCRSQTLPGVVPDSTWAPQVAVAVYRWNNTTGRYEYAETRTPE